MSSKFEAQSYLDNISRHIYRYWRTRGDAFSPYEVQRSLQLGGLIELMHHYSGIFIDIVVRGEHTPEVLTTLSLPPLPRLAEITKREADQLQIIALDNDDQTLELPLAELQAIIQQQTALASPSDAEPNPQMTNIDESILKFAEQLYAVLLPLLQDNTFHSLRKGQQGN